MIGHYFSRLIILLFGTLYPAYSSYKAVKNRDVRQYSRWMIYWIVFALFSFVEVFSDVFISFWLPFYYEMKILFVLWLMSPYGNGSKILYLHLIHPQLTSHEQIIDSYIDSAKQMGVLSVWHLWRKVAELGNKVLIYFFQISQTILFYQIQNNTNNSNGAIIGPQIQTQQLLSQSHSNFLQQFLFSRPVNPCQNQPINISPQRSDASDQLDGANAAQRPMGQRWYSEEAINLVEVSSELSPSRHSMNLRMRSESESNLDDWQHMDIDSPSHSKPPVQPNKVRKRTKAIKSTDSSADKPVRRTARAAAVKARAKCKGDQSFEEE